MAQARPPLLQLLRGPSGELWEVCIGLEVHAQVLSRSKLMSGAAASTVASSSARPNRHVSFFDAALPGTLPVLNRECVHQAIRTGLALNATVHVRSLFERKHYFYCDLPLGYQVTQQRAPIASGGALRYHVPVASIVSEHGGAARTRHVAFDASKYKSRKEKNEALRTWRNNQATKPQLQELVPKSVRIARIQLEQDSGKSIHDLEERDTVVDFNRAGTALLEIVLEPDLRSPVEAGAVVRHLQHLLRHLHVCDGNMEDGSMRCDVNVSVRPLHLGHDEADDASLERALASHGGAAPFGERVEIKNMNSIRNLVRAAEYEARRQIALAETKGESVHRETRSFDARTGETKRMRSKEGATDYRFFPEPDLPPLVLSDTLVQAIRNEMPELPEALRTRLMTQYDLTPYEASVLVHEPGAASFFEQVAAHTSRPAKMVANWVLNDLFGHLKALHRDVSDSPVDAPALGALLDLILDGTISGKIAKDVLAYMCFENEGQRTPREIVQAKGWEQIHDPDEIRALCRAVLEDPKGKNQLAAFHKGKTQLFGYFLGQVMQRSHGRVNPEVANTILQETLDERR